MISKSEQEQLFGPQIKAKPQKKKSLSNQKHEFKQLEDLVRCSICFERYQTLDDENDLES